MALIIVSILIGSPISAFINVAGLVIVVGGTVMATLIMQRLNVVLGAFKIAMNVFFIKTEAPEKIIQRIGKLAARAKKEGLLALEEEEIPNAFLARGVRMAVDGVSPEDIVSSLQTDLISQLRRHQTGQQIFRFMGATAPAMGMIGTLIGLVQMLRKLDDPANIGPAMAVALLTTFYGAVMAFLFFIPIAEKLKDRTDEERMAKELIIEGVKGIIEGANPRILDDKLLSFVPPAKRNLEEEEEAKAEAKAEAEEGEEEAA
jgi:chemotaxis protein MotA